MHTARLPTGSREYLLNRAERLTDTLRLLSDAFEAWGARRVVPTSLVALNYVPDPDRALVFRTQTGAMLAMRQDVTEQIRHIVDSALKHLPLPYKLYYLERVWSDEPFAAQRQNERLQAGVEWIGPGPGSDAALLQFAVELARVFDPGTPTLILSDARLRDAWLSDCPAGERDDAEVALNLRSQAHWQALTVSARWPHLPWLTVTSASDLPANTPPAVCDIVATLLQLAAGIDGVDAVIDPVGRPAADYYSGMVFALASGVAGDPWLRGGRYDGRFNTSAEALGFTIDLDTVIDAGERDALRCRRLPRWGWAAPGSPPKRDDVRWLPLDASIVDVCAWAAAHGLDGIAVVEGGRVRVLEPRSGAELATL